MGTKTLTYICGHTHQVPNNSNWPDYSSSPCDDCYQQWAPDVPTYTEEELESMSARQQEIEDYGFDKSFER